MKQSSIVFLLLMSVIPSVFSEDDVEEAPPSYKEISYYLRKLEETNLEDNRVKFTKMIHDALVSADLSDKKVVRDIQPIIEKIQKAMDSGLDRGSLTGQTNWLSSAVDYFEREKRKPLVEISESDWLSDQSKMSSGLTLSTYPDRILLHNGKKTEKIAEGSFIHEAILSTDGKWLAYFRHLSDQTENSEIWVVRLSNKKAKRIATVDSCYTILFSLDGDHIYFQEHPKAEGLESGIYSIPTGGGRSHKICDGVLLSTVVEKGRYKGSVIVYRRRMHHLGVSWLTCPYAFRESGDAIGRLINAGCK